MLRLFMPSYVLNWKKKIESLDKLHHEISKKIRVYDKNTDNNGSINEHHWNIAVFGRKCSCTIHAGTTDGHSLAETFSVL